MDQLRMLEKILGRPVRTRSVPPRLLIWIATGLGLLGRLILPLEERAEYARIGYYYATESMLVWDPVNQIYDEAATPSFGNDRLEDHYRRLIGKSI
jgi:divinyl chlorophyllide a 8-vinyl-reductase